MGSQDMFRLLLRNSSFFQRERQNIFRFRSRYSCLLKCLNTCSTRVGQSCGTVFRFVSVQYGIDSRGSRQARSGRRALVASGAKHLGTHTGELRVRVRVASLSYKVGSTQSVESCVPDENPGFPILLHGFGKDIILCTSRPSATVFPEPMQKDRKIWALMQFTRVERNSDSVIIL